MRTDKPAYLPAKEHQHIVERVRPRRDAEAAVDEQQAHQQAEEGAEEESLIPVLTALNQWGKPK
jgi:hypothetical protein